MQVKDVDSVDAQIGAAALHLVVEELGSHGVNASGHVFRLEPGGNGAGSEETGLGRHHDLIALQLAEGRAHGALGTLAAVVDGGIEEVDPVFRGGEQRIGVGAVEGVVFGAQIGADAEAGNLEVEDGAMETAVRRETVEKARGPCGGGEHYSDTALESIRRRISPMNSASGFAPWSPCLRLRTATCPFCCSRSPTTSM